MASTTSCALLVVKAQTLVHQRAGHGGVIHFRESTVPLGVLHNVRDAGAYLSLELTIHCVTLMFHHVIKQRAEVWKRTRRQHSLR